MTSNESISTRPVLPTDDNFIYEVYASTRADELAGIPWTVPQKDAFVRMQLELRERQYRAEYPAAITEVILRGGIPAGTMITLKTADAMRLMDIAILPQFRGAGIGTTILRRLQKEGKKVSLHVLKQNPAVHLYAKLGFVSVAEDSMYLQMAWSPQ